MGLVGRCVGAWLIGCVSVGYLGELPCAVAWVDCVVTLVGSAALQAGCYYLALESIREAAALITAYSFWPTAVGLPMLLWLNRKLEAEYDAG